MPTEPNPTDVIGMLIAQGHAYVLLVQLLEANGALPVGLTRDALDRLIEQQQAAGVTEIQLRVLNEIQKSLALRPPG